MKKIAVICLVASLAVSMNSSVTALAQSAISLKLKIVQVKAVLETDTKAANEDLYPADWDADDPENARAFQQMYGDEQTADDVAENDSIATFSLEEEWISTQQQWNHNEMGKLYIKQCRKDYRY